MPIYPYVCTACGHEFDSLQKISDDPLTECPECSESALRKRLAAPAFKLKGTGWYETDFKNSGKKDKSDGKDKDAAASGKKDDTAKSGSQDKSASKGSSSESKTATAGGKDD